MGRVVAGDADISNPEGGLAGRDHADFLGRFVIVGKCCGRVGISPDVESLHPSKLVSLSDCVLVSFDVFPCKGHWELLCAFKNFVDDTHTQG